jgi:nitrous oxide reductase accessory protein NosL
MGNLPSFRIFVFSLVMISVFLAPFMSDAETVPDGAVCAECGMKVDPESKFISYILASDGKKLYFCDVGDMLIFLADKNREAKGIFVRDYQTGEWMDGKASCYVKNEGFKTPMGWNIAAFKDPAGCGKWGETKDFAGAGDLLGTGGKKTMRH